MSRQGRLWTAWTVGEDGNAPQNPAGYRLSRRFWGRQVARMFMPAVWRMLPNKRRRSRRSGFRVWSRPNSNITRINS